MFKKTVVIIMSTIFLTFSLLPGATNSAVIADETDQNVIKTLSQLETFVDEQEIVENEEFDNYVQEFKKLLAQDKIEFKTTNKIDYRSISVIRNTKTNDIIINVPFNTDNSLQYEIGTVILDKNSDLVDYQEQKITGNDKTYAVSIDVINNGQKHSESIQLEAKHFKENATLTDTMDTPQLAGVGGFLSKFNDCLASQGIAAWAITAASIACGALGPTPAGVACMHGLSFLTGGVIGYCFEKALRFP